MTTEQLVRLTIGDLVIQNLAYQSQVEQLTKEKAALQEKLDERDKTPSI